MVRYGTQHSRCASGRQSPRTNGDRSTQPGRYLQAAKWAVIVATEARKDMSW